MVASVSFTPAQESDILERYQGGQSVKAVAAMLGCSSDPITDLLRRHGVYEGRARTRRLTPEQERAAITRYADGESARAIALSFGCTTGKAVERVLKEHGSYEYRFVGFTAAEEGHLVARYQASESANSLAKDYGVSHSAVVNVLKQHGVYEARRHRGFTVEQEDEIARLYIEGRTAAEVARRFGCTHPPIERILRERGVYDGQRARAGSKFTMDQKREMAARYEAGASIYALAADYGCSPNGMWKLLTQLGVEMRFHGRLEGRKTAQGKYIRVQIDESDPIAKAMGWVNGWAPEHRLVMARALGRPLAKRETVHHINGDPTDNRLENLQLRNGNHGKGAKFTCLDCGSHNVAATPL